MSTQLNTFDLITGKQAFESGMITPERLGHFAHWGTVRAFGVNRKLYTNHYDWELIKRRQGYSLRNKISFHFDLAEYKAAKNIEDDDVAKDQYRKDLLKMWFVVNEIERSLAVFGAGSGNIETTNNGVAESKNTQSIETELVKHRGPGRPRKEER